MGYHINHERRYLLRTTGIALCALAIGASPVSATQESTSAEEISPVEDLMREHGVLRRILFIYRDSMGRIRDGQNISWSSIYDSASIIHSFIENYHERLEEDHIFPAMLKSGKWAGLVDILKKQHEAGRKLTALVMQTAGKKDLNKSDQEIIYRALDSFVRMYDPHASREDTVLFPALHVVLGAKEYERMGEVFEKEENRLFGEHGFEKMVSRVTDIEKKIGLFELSQFTPKVT
jgi:hemerythrin-like domain-containing protein